MGFKSILIRPFARLIAGRLQREARDATLWQDRVLRSLVGKGAATVFGKDHRISLVKDHKDYRNAVPIRDYEALRPYIDRIRAGERDILWPGRPRYFAKTSGTTSGVKYIPITTDSIPNHIASARNALFNYSASTGNFRFFDGNMIFLSGSPTLEDTGGIPTGRLSGIVNHLVPAWIRSNQLPSYDTNCIEDWDLKLTHIVNETVGRDMRLISGIPPWVQMYYERLLEATGQGKITDIFPNYSLFVHGGVNYAPYAPLLGSLVGRDIDTLETYPASEGFIAYQDTWPFAGLRLNVNSGIFFEFVPLGEVDSDNPTRLTLKEVETGKDYALLITNNAGLWSYNIGDTVRFVSLSPPRIVVSGRVTHFISAFGEHVIASEVETAMQQTCAEYAIDVIEFTVAPQVSPADGGAPYHEWFVELAANVQLPEGFPTALDTALAEKNIYYRDLRDGNVLREARVTRISENGFRKYMESQGKLGGQNKIPRLGNNRTFVDGLTPYIGPR